MPGEKHQTCYKSHVMCSKLREKCVQIFIRSGQAMCKLFMFLRQGEWRWQKVRWDFRCRLIRPHGFRTTKILLSSAFRLDLVIPPLLASHLKVHLKCFLPHTESGTLSPSGASQLRRESFTLIPVREYRTVYKLTAKTWNRGMETGSVRSPIFSAYCKGN